MIYKKNCLVFIAFILAVFNFMSCSYDEEDFCCSYEKLLETKMTETEKTKVKIFEQDYINNNFVSTRSEYDGIKLVGYKTVSYHGDDSILVNRLWEFYQKEIELCGYALTLDGKARIYFKMSDAILNIDGKKIVADSSGVIHDIDFTENTKIELIGSEKSETSIYTEFANKYVPEKFYQNENVYIFNLGERDQCSSKKIKVRRKISISEETSEGRVSCTQNHPGYHNCSEAYRIMNDRCTFNPNRCMDYNGYGTDCSGSHAYFIGSDCSIALAQGHCWNEVM